MPVVEKTSGGRVFIRTLDRRFEIGDRAEVSDETASYLCEERGDFQEVDADTDTESDSAGDGDDAETYTCAGETSDGESCTREVEEPGGYCYQHGEA